MKIQRHPLAPMLGRNPDQVGRAATPLELLYDLTLVVAFGVAADQLADALAKGHILSGIVGFVLAMYAVVWCWINFTWFSSAYDNDDLFMRACVTAQMVGVVILSLGLPALFTGLHNHWELQEQTVVAGYVVMRVALIALWIRAWKHDKARRPTTSTYIIGITIAQLMWITLILIDVPVLIWGSLVVVIYIVEMLVPYIAENRQGRTPWHPHHIAERYGLLALIALGEGVVGTVDALNSLIGAHGWTLEVWMLAFCGMGLTVGMWWLYFGMPSAELIAANVERVFAWAYGHIPVYAAIAATGAGLELIALGFAGDSVISRGNTVLVVAIALGVYMTLVFGLFHYIDGQIPFRTVLALFLSLLLLAAAVIGIFFGLPDYFALILITLTSWIPIFHWELRPA
ncbi:MAG: low temperature requirement protein A [Propionibacteriaceae bacterium]|jgi:low temperature requirement protein LtrA|nr:low temperature requirement protein A [Propionibacteriaceae bacterium]